MRHNLLISSLLVSATLVAMPAVADQGRFIATGGATSIEGSAGGGIVPWATLSSYAEEGQWGATAAVTEVSVDDFRLSVLGVSLSYDNRIELSAAKQTFDLSTIGGELKQDVFGVKYRVAGDLIYGDLPQFSVGLQHKRNRTFALPSAVGAQSDSGTDYYLSAAKVWLDGPFHRTWLANITLRATKANQIGLLGFGGDQNDDYELQPEVAVGMFINRNWAVGAEYRTKPDNLGFAEEHDWYDIFVAYFPTKSVSVVAAYADLDSIAGLADQTGWYLSLQATF
ncbi:DUF3034 family protein [Pseudidiomarina aestuarii]|uniref:DUF3034 family protein n=1 Tax=Pseudidiomarina aestuarii TaxID=624146 RepID=UPI003A971415